MINCVAIDDEPLARDCIINYAREIDFLQLVGTGNNPMELIQLLDEKQVDLIFLDIQMPKMNGIDFLKMAQNPPMVILTTAYPSYALEGYQLDVLDYLLKPITFNRFFKAVAKAKNHHQLLQSSINSTSTNSNHIPDYCFVKCENKYEKIYFDEILYIQAMQNYVVIYTTKKKYVTLMSLKSVEENLENATFLRVHKSYIISIPKVSTIEQNEVWINEERIPISRNYKESVLKRILGSELWQK